MKIRVVGIGNGGCNIADRLGHGAVFADMDTVYYDYETDDLHRHSDERSVKCLLDIDCQFDFNIFGDHYDITIIASSLGGRATSEFSRRIAKEYRRWSKLTIGIVTFPFVCEGPQRNIAAESTYNDLKTDFDIIIVQKTEFIPGDMPVNHINTLLCETVCRALEQFIYEHTPNAPTLKSLLISSVEPQWSATDFLTVV